MYIAITIVGLLVIAAARWLYYLGYHNGYALGSRDGRIENNLEFYRRGLKDGERNTRRAHRYGDDDE